MADIKLNTTSGSITLSAEDGAGATTATIPKEASELVVKNSSGVTSLEHNDSVKLATTATGIDVTGTVTTDGIYLGGTGSANYLDDYEEGTWTPVLGQGFTISVINLAVYVKIGSTVHLQMDAIFTGTGTSSELQLSGLPFTNVSNGWACSRLRFQSCLVLFLLLMPFVFSCPLLESTRNN